MPGFSAGELSPSQARLLRRGNIHLLTFPLFNTPESTAYFDSPPVLRPSSSATPTSCMPCSLVRSSQHCRRRQLPSPRARLIPTSNFHLRLPRALFLDAKARSVAQWLVHTLQSEQSLDTLNSES